MGRKGFSSTNSWSSDWKRTWGPVIVAQYMRECSTCEFARLCVLESSVGQLKFPGVENNIIGIEILFFFKAPFHLSELNLLIPFYHQKNQRELPACATITQDTLIPVIPGTQSPPREWDRGYRWKDEPVTAIYRWRGVVEIALGQYWLETRGWSLPYVFAALWPCRKHSNNVDPISYTVKCGWSGIGYLASIPIFLMMGLCPNKPS